MLFEKIIDQTKCELLNSAYLIFAQFFFIQIIAALIRLKNKGSRHIKNVTAQANLSGAALVSTKKKLFYENRVGLASIFCCGVLELYIFQSNRVYYLGKFLYV